MPDQHVIKASRTQADQKGGRKRGDRHRDETRLKAGVETRSLHELPASPAMPLRRLLMLRSHPRVSEIGRRQYSVPPVWSIGSVFLPPHIRQAVLVQDPIVLALEASFVAVFTGASAKLPPIGLYDLVPRHIEIDVVVPDERFLFHVIFWSGGSSRRVRLQRDWRWHQTRWRGKAPNVRRTHEGPRIMSLCHGMRRPASGCNTTSGRREQRRMEMQLRRL